MCGIAGIMRFGINSITEEEVAILVTSLEHRGNHATGMVVVNNNGTELAVHKMPGPAWNFIKHDSTKGFMAQHFRPDTNIVLLHTRYYTVGDPSNNGNNHPLFAGKTAVVHNGSIRNHAELFTSMSLKRRAETDSDVIRAIFDEDGFTPKAARNLSKGIGNGAIAAVSTDYPYVLALGRSGNPLIIGSQNDKLYFASELRAIHKAIRPWEQRHGIWMRPESKDFARVTMPDDTMYYISPNETTHHELRICTNFVPPVYRSHETFADRMRVWRTSSKPNRVFCKCRACGTVQSKFEGTSWEDSKCGNKDCGISLAYLKDAEKAVA